MKNILPEIKREKAKMIHWYGLPTTTKEERKEISKRIKRLVAIENKIIAKYF